MCKHIYLPMEQKLVRTMRELLKVVPEEKVVWAEGYERARTIYEEEKDDPHSDFCLCAVDIEQTGKANGYVAIVDDDVGYWVTDAEAKAP